MRDLAFVAFLFGLFGIAFKRPFIFVLAYVYVEILAPQRITYHFLNQIPTSLICFVFVAGFWVLAENKKDTRIAPRQIVLLLLLVYCFFTTQNADFPTEALEKWSWVWKSLFFAAFLPLMLKTRLRIESMLLFMMLSAATIIIIGGIKTVVTRGGGYGVLNLMVTNNSGIYESSTIATFSIAVVPIIIVLLKHNSFFAFDWRAKIFGAGLIFACLLMPIGTQARAGLVCVPFLGVLMLRHVKYRAVYLGLLALAAVAAFPFLPERLQGVTEYKADQSASTRIQVWKWTWEYAKDHPFGGGFEAYRQNKIQYETAVSNSNNAQIAAQAGKMITDEGRHYHNAYFEMLGEQGYLGLALWLFIHIGGLLRMEILQRRYRKRTPDESQWIGLYADALQKAHIMCLVGSLFVSIAFQAFIMMLIGVQIGLDVYASRLREKDNWKPMRAPELPPIMLREAR